MLIVASNLAGSDLRGSSRLLWGNPTSATPIFISLSPEATKAHLNPDYPATIETDTKVMVMNVIGLFNEK